jgi:hypothetical protein
MNREQLAHVLRARVRNRRRPDILVIGSQSLLASYDEDELPLTATASMEVDAQGVSVRTAVLPNGWRDRVVHWSNNSTGRARRFSRTARLRGVQARRLPRCGWCSGGRAWFDLSDRRRHRDDLRVGRHGPAACFLTRIAREGRVCAGLGPGQRLVSPLSGRRSVSRHVSACTTRLGLDSRRGCQGSSPPNVVRGNLEVNHSAWHPDTSSCDRPFLTVIHFSDLRIPCKKRASSF